MFQPSSTHASAPDSGPFFDCASPFASIALVQLAGGGHLGGRLQRCLTRLFERRKAR